MNREMLGHITDNIGHAMLYWTCMVIAFGEAEALGYSGYVGSLLGAILACVVLTFMTAKQNV